MLHCAVPTPSTSAKWQWRRVRWATTPALLVNHSASGVLSLLLRLLHLGGQVRLPGWSVCCTWGARAGGRHQGSLGMSGPQDGQLMQEVIRDGLRMGSSRCTWHVSPHAHQPHYSQSNYLIYKRQMFIWSHWRLWTCRVKTDLRDALSVPQVDHVLQC